MTLTKHDLDAIGDIVQKSVDPELIPVRQEFRELRDDVKALREQIQQLTITLDHFLKRLTNYEEEFTILRAF